MAKPLVKDLIAQVIATLSTEGACDVAKTGKGMNARQYASFLRAILEQVPSAFFDEDTGVLTLPKATEQATEQAKGAKAYFEKRRELGVVVMHAKRLRGDRPEFGADHISKLLIAPMEGWECVVEGSDVVAKAREHLQNAKLEILRAAEKLDLVPQGWSPAKHKNNASKALSVGSVAKIASRFADEYRDFLDAVDLCEGMVVQATNAKQTALKTKGGNQVFIKTSHLFAA